MTTREWTVYPVNYSESGGSVVSLLNGDLLLCTGIGTSIIFNPISGTSTFLSNTPPNISHCCIATGINRVLMIGGSDGSTITDTCYSFDVANSQWTQIASLNVPRRKAVAVVLNDGKLLAVGGINGNGQISSCEIYNPTLNSWTLIDELPTGIQMARPYSGRAPIFTLANDKVVIPGAIFDHHTLAWNKIRMEVGNPAYGSAEVGWVIGQSNDDTLVTATGSVFQYNENALFIPEIQSPLQVTVKHNDSLNYQILAINDPTSFDAIGLPSGTSIDSVLGIISGTPTEFGLFNVTLFAQNLDGVGNANLMLEALPAPPVITSLALVTGQVNVPFSFKILASNLPDLFYVDTLPNGLDLNPSTGVISGQPTVPGDFNIQINARNLGGTNSGLLQISILPATPVFLDETTILAQVGKAIMISIIVQNSPTHYSIKDLPPGLSFSHATGTISGTPLVSGTFPLSLSASNPGGSASIIRTMEILPANNTTEVSEEGTSVGCGLGGGMALFIAFLIFSCRSLTAHHKK